MSIKILMLENIHPKSVNLFHSQQYEVEHLSTSLSEAALIDKLADVQFLCIRSKTQITQKVLAQAKNLWGIGNFCIGTNNVDLATATEKGIIVFNAPYSNTRSVVELTLGNIIGLMRQMPHKSQNLHQGKWLKSASQSYEIRGKKLGIVGYGNIGSQLSVLAESLGLDIYYYDIIEKLALGNAKKCQSLEALLQKVDIVSVHIDGRNMNDNLFDNEKFALMKSGSYFLNLSRGSVVNIDHLAHNLSKGHLAGAAVDVFPEEPASNDQLLKSPLQGIQNVILTPHIGGSTLEAQENISEFVAGQLISYIQTGSSVMSVNFPEIKLPHLQQTHRMIHIHHNKPGVMGYINDVFAKHQINIVGQYLKTSEDLGYVITDVSKEYDESIIDELKNHPHTIRFRTLS